MLYTRKGDGGTTKTYGCDQRISKSSAVAEALGSLDEINSFLGLVKVKAQTFGVVVPTNTHHTAPLHDILHIVQETLFSIQAQVAGFDKKIPEERVRWTELIVDHIEKELPPITTFFISGGTELAALCDVARTIARRAERRVVGVHDEVTQGGPGPEIDPQTLAFLNRLSSLLYACARYANHVGSFDEQAPTYK